jgi:hypothetical protein
MVCENIVDSAVISWCLSFSHAGLADTVQTRHVAVICAGGDRGMTENPLQSPDQRSDTERNHGVAGSSPWNPVTGRENQNGHH